MALDFPSAPSVGDHYPPPPAPPRWVWNGTSWVSAPIVTGLYLPLTGGTLTGPGDLTVRGLTHLDDDATVDGDVTVTGGVTADHVTTTGTSLDVAGSGVIHGDLTVHGDADFDADVRIQGDPVATAADVDAVRNLGLYAGSFATYAAVPTNTSGFPHLTQNDFITVRADETQTPAGGTTRYVASNIATDGTITWTYDITYSTDVSGKMDLVAGATNGHLAMLDIDGQAEDAGFAEADLFVLSTTTTLTQGTDFNDATGMVALLQNRRFDSNVTITITTPQSGSPTLKNVFIPQYSITINADDTIAASLGIRGIYGGSLIIFGEEVQVPFIVSQALTIADASVIFQGSSNIGTNLTLTRGGNASIDVGAHGLNVWGNLTIGAGCTLTVGNNLFVQGNLTNNGLLIIAPSVQFNCAGTIAGNGQTIDNRSYAFPSWALSPIDTFARKALSITKGVAGSYGQTADFPGGDFQAFLDQFINNRWFDGNITITLDFDITTPIVMRNVRGAIIITINSAFQIASTFNTYDMGVRLIINCTAPTAIGSATFQGSSVNLLGTTSFGNLSFAYNSGGTYGDIAGNAAANIQITNLTLNSPSMVYLGNNGTLSIGALNNQGIVIIPATASNLTLPATITGNGQIIDNRPNSPADTYQRVVPPPQLMNYSKAGNFIWRCPCSGRYLVVACGAGGGGIAWFGNPLNTTTGSVPLFGGGGTGAIVRNENLFTKGQLVGMQVGWGGKGGTSGGTTTNGSSGSGWGDQGGTTTVNDTGLWAAGGGPGALYGQTPQGGWGGNVSGPTAGYGLTNGINGTRDNGGSDSMWTANTTYYGSIGFRGGRGGNPGDNGGDGQVTFIYMGAT